MSLGIISSISSTLPNKSKLIGKNWGNPPKVQLSWTCQLLCDSHGVKPSPKVALLFLMHLLLVFSFCSFSLRIANQLISDRSISAPAVPNPCLAVQNYRIHQLLRGSDRYYSSCYLEVFKIAIIFSATPFAEAGF